MRPPTASATVPASRATAARRVAGSRTKTIVPAGASISSPATVKARPARDDDVQLLLPPRVVAGLVVLLEQQLAVPGAERVDREAGGAELVAQRQVLHAGDGYRLDLVEAQHAVRRGHPAACAPRATAAASAACSWSVGKGAPLRRNWYAATVAPCRTTIRSA